MMFHQDPKLEQFARVKNLIGLSRPSLAALYQGRSGYTVEKARRFLVFQDRIDRELLRHPIITANRYTAWFMRGEQSVEQVKDFIVQFSVFSNLFLVAQLFKTINADTVDGMRASKEILANEIGVVFNPSNQLRSAVEDVENEGDPELVSIDGSVEGGVFHFRAAHFEWLFRIANHLGLGFNELGKRRHGTKSTLYFCDELVRLYGNEDYWISQAASYAVENWAAAGFWGELIEGFRKFNRQFDAGLPLAFFTWHDRLESQHALHTQEELEEMYFGRELDEDDFIRVGNEMLDGVAEFWNGLETQRQSLAA